MVVGSSIKDMIKVITSPFWLVQVTPSMYIRWLKSNILFNVAGRECFGGALAAHTRHWISWAACTTAGRDPLIWRALASRSLAGCPRFLCILRIVCCSHRGNCLNRRLCCCMTVSGIPSWSCFPSRWIISSTCLVSPSWGGPLLLTQGFFSGSLAVLGRGSLLDSGTSSPGASGPGAAFSCALDFIELSLFWSVWEWSWSLANAVMFSRLACAGRVNCRFDRWIHLSQFFSYWMLPSLLRIRAFLYGASCGCKLDGGATVRSDPLQPITRTISLSGNMFWICCIKFPLVISRVPTLGNTAEIAWMACWHISSDGSLPWWLLERILLSPGPRCGVGLSNSDLANCGGCLTFEVAANTSFSGLEKQIIPGCQLNGHWWLAFTKTLATALANFRV